MAGLQPNDPCRGDGIDLATCRAMLQVSRCGAWCMDLQAGAFRYVSEPARRTWGIAPHEVGRYRLPEDFLERVAPEHRAVWEAILAGRRDVRQIEYRWRCPDGRVRWLRDRLSRRGGRTGLLLGAVSDIHERKALAERLIRMRGRLHRFGARRADALRHRLTPAEQAVLDLLLAGLGNKQIAQRLCRSVRTVEDHRAHIMTKAGAGNIVDLVKAALDVTVSS